MQARLYSIYPREASLSVIGLMAGTSMDGIDAALVDIAGSGVDARIAFHGFRCYPYPAEVRERLMSVASGERVPVSEVSELNFIVGGLFGEAAASCAADLGVQIDRIHVIASHGQTVFHQGARTGDSTASTLQIGEAAVIANRAGVPVVSDFRTADIAAGGEGAPLVPYFDFIFLRDRSASRAAQNIGGIANVTYLPGGCDLDGVIAFDNGPGNMLIDAAAARFTGGRLQYDLNGLMALRGKLNDALLGRLLDHPFYSRRPPKTAGREQFGMRYLDELLSLPEARGLSADDALATLTALTAETIVRSYRDLLPGSIDEIVLSGGGARNPALVEMIERATRTRVRKFDDFGIPGDAKEAVAFALLGSETARGVASNVPSATGAAHPAVLGKVTLPWR